jgi:hypothetical protein
MWKRNLVGILCLVSVLGCATWAVTLAQAQTWVSSHNNLVVPV